MSPTTPEMNCFSQQNCKSPSEHSFSQEWSLCIIHVPVATVPYALVSWGWLPITMVYSLAPSCTSSPSWPPHFHASQYPLHTLFFHLLWGAVFSRAWLQSAKSVAFLCSQYSLKCLLPLWKRKRGSHPNSSGQQGKENPPHPSWRSHILFSEQIWIVCLCVLGWGLCSFYTKIYFLSVRGPKLVFHAPYGA